MRIVRYFFVGGVAACVDIGLFFVFAKWLNLNYLVVSACTFLLATFVNYMLSVRHVFPSGARFGRRQEVVLVYLVSVIGLGLNQLVLYACAGLIGIELMLSKLTATGMVFFWNYGARAHFVFRHRSLEEP